MLRGIVLKRIEGAPKNIRSKGMKTFQGTPNLQFYCNIGILKREGMLWVCNGLSFKI